MTTGVAILGSTGSIGCSTLQVLARQRERFRVVALTAHSNGELLEQQARDWQPAFVGLVNGENGARGRGKGKEALIEAATHPDAQIVVNGIVGAAEAAAEPAPFCGRNPVALATHTALRLAGQPMGTRGPLASAESRP